MVLNKYGIVMEWHCIILLNYKSDKYNIKSIPLYNNMSSVVMVDIGILQFWG